MQERSPENRRTDDGIIENYYWSEVIGLLSLSPLLLHAGNRYSPLSLLDIAPRIINAIVSLIRGVNASCRELRTRISRRDERDLRQIPLHNSVARTTAA